MSEGALGGAFSCKAASTGLVWPTAEVTPWREVYWPLRIDALVGEHWGMA